MAKKRINDSAQTVLHQRFEFKFDDTMKDSTGVEKDFGKTNIAATIFEVMDLPVGAVITSGQWTTKTAFDTAAYTVSIGDVGSAARYLAATDLKGAARTALVPTGYVSDGKPLRISVTNADVCTAGEAALDLQYVIRNRANEGA